MFKKITAVLTLALFTTLTSCSSDDSGASTSAGSISATIDGQAWQSISGGAIATLVNNQFGSENGTVLQIVAMQADQSSVTMQFPIANLTEGTYTFTEDMAGQLSYMASFSGVNIFSSANENGSFTITITDVNNEAGTLSGTFSGTVVDFMGTQTVAITNGVINNVSFANTDIYTNGSMTLTNNGNTVTMDGSSGLGISLWIMESDLSNTISVTGTYTALDNSFGIYNLSFPKDVAPGTYSLTSEEGFSAGFANSDPDYNVTEGSITIVSHVGNTIVATFNFYADNSLNGVNITNGQLTFEHHD